jgi:hypothetical protein
VGFSDRDAVGVDRDAAPFGGGYQVELERHVRKGTRAGGVW